MNERTHPHVIKCADGLGRRRVLEVFLNDHGFACLRTPGESAELDWFEVDQLRGHLEELRIARVQARSGGRNAV